MINNAKGRCQAYDRTNPERKKILQGLISRAKTRATKPDMTVLSSAYGKEFDLTIEWANDQINKQENKCPITGIEFYYGPSIEHHGKSGHPARPSPNRIDPSKGYTQDNVEIVCNLVNKMYGTWTTEEVKPFLCGIAESYSK